MKENINATQLSNNEIKLKMMNLENEYKSIQANIKKEIKRMNDIDKEYKNFKIELNKRLHLL